MEGQGEILTQYSRQEAPVDRANNNERETHNFVHASVHDLDFIRRISARIKEESELREDERGGQLAEQVYKDASLELFFRMHGEEYRNEYNKWLMIKKKKEQDWELQMYDKYGPEWREQTTEADRELLVYTSIEMEAYEKHKAIEEKALQLQEKDIDKLKEKEKEEAGKDSRGDFFKLVKARTLMEFPFLNEREVHKAVYSIDFLFFYIRLLTRSAIGKGIKQMRGKEVPEYVEFERKMNQSAIFVRELAIHNRMKPKSPLFSLTQAA